LPLSPLLRLFFTEVASRSLFFAIKKDNPALNFTFALMFKIIKFTISSFEGLALVLTPDF